VAVLHCIAYTFDDEPSVRAVAVDVGAGDTLVSAGVVDLRVVQSQRSADVVDAQSRVSVTTEFQLVVEPSYGQRRHLAVVGVGVTLQLDRRRHVHCQVARR